MRARCADWSNCGDHGAQRLRVHAAGVDDNDRRRGGTQPGGCRSAPAGDASSRRSLGRGLAPAIVRRGDQPSPRVCGTCDRRVARLAVVEPACALTIRMHDSRCALGMVHAAIRPSSGGRQSARHVARAVAVAARMTRPTNWMNLGFMAAVHIAAIAIVVWSRPTWPTLALGLVLYCCSGLSITAGYHRLFAHRSYRCAPAVRLFYLLFGAAAVQNSAI